MKKITEITFSEGKTIQENSYEPRSFHFSAKMEIQNEDIQKSFDELKEEVQKALHREVLKWRDPKKFLKEEQEYKQNNNPF